jgi:hypothetical protein
MKHWTLKAKILGIVATLLGLLVILGSVTILLTARQDRINPQAMQRFSDAIEVKNLAIGALAQYQALANSVINQSTDTKDYDKAPMTHRNAENAQKASDLSRQTRQAVDKASATPIRHGEIPLEASFKDF